MTSPSLPAPILTDSQLGSFMAALSDQAKVCVLVPAYNEEKVLAHSLRRLRRVFGAESVYVVSDGSTDRSAEIARRYTLNVLELTENTGKANALSRLITAYALDQRYEYALFSDADSYFDLNFLAEVKRHMKGRPACIVGAVTSQRHGLISAYRSYEYALSNLVLKRAQGIVGVVTVAPGCASLYRADILKELEFSQSTLTEDFDLTLQIHQKRLGRIVYVPGAKVMTQDPRTLRDYWRQIMRWYVGFWQNFVQHQVYKRASKVNAELLLTVGDALVLLVSLATLIAYPMLVINAAAALLLGTFVIAVSVLAITEQLWAVRYMPFFILFQFINLTAFVLAFAKVAGRSKSLSWNKVKRYALS